MPVIDLRLTPVAAAKLHEHAGPERLALRIYVTGGGCGGYRYGMMLEDAPVPTDFVIDSQGERIVVDEASSSMLDGAEIDYVDSLMGAGFTVKNPNAGPACACGTSFRGAEGGGEPGGCGH